MKLYPIHITMDFHITDGETVGSVNFSCGLHRLPTEADMPEIIQKVNAALPDGFRLMNRHESTMYYLVEERGYSGPSLALPTLEENEEWHDPETANCYGTLYQECEGNA